MGVGAQPLGVALLPAGRRWDVLIVPGARGRATLDVLILLVERPGPVLADFPAARRGRTATARLGFFVPPGTASRWVGTGYAEQGAERGSWSRTRAGRRAACAGW